MNRTAIITSAGSGERFGFTKQFVPINGKPVFMHTLEKFIQSGMFSNVLLTIPEDSKDIVENIICNSKYEDQVVVVFGGDTRQESIKNALFYLSVRKPPDKVVITDANRPCIKLETIKQFAEKLDSLYSLVSVCPTVNTQCYISEEVEIIDRNKMHELLMPQGFDFEWLYSAHTDPRSEKLNATDDSQLVKKVHGCGPEYFLMDKWEGIKLTNPEDYYVIAKILERNK